MWSGKPFICKVVPTHGFPIANVLYTNLLDMFLFSFSNVVNVSSSHSMWKCLCVRKHIIVLLTAPKIVFVYEIGMAWGSQAPGVKARERGAITKCSCVCITLGHEPMFSVSRNVTPMQGFNTCQLKKKVDAPPCMLAKRKRGIGERRERGFKRQLLPFPVLSLNASWLDLLHLS